MLPCTPLRSTARNSARACVAMLFSLTLLLSAGTANAFSDFTLLQDSQVSVDIGNSVRTGAYAPHTPFAIDQGAVNGNLKELTLRDFFIPDTVAQLGQFFSFDFGTLGGSRDIDLTWNMATGDVFSEVFRVRMNFGVAENTYDIFLTTIGTQVDPWNGAQLQCAFNTQDPPSPFGQALPAPLTFGVGEGVLVGFACPVVEAGIPMQLGNNILGLKLNFMTPEPGTGLLIGSGLIGLGLSRRRQARS